MTSVAERLLPECEHLGRADREDEGGACAPLVLEPAVARLEPPAAVPLRGPRGGELLQRLVVGHALGATLDDDVQPAVPGVAAGGEHHVRVLPEVVPLLLFVAR